MTVASVALPPVDLGRTLWEHLVAGDDPTASADFAEAYLGPLITSLGRRYPRVDTAIRETAAGEAIFSLIKNPLAYRPERQTLDAYLRMSATGDLKNLLRSEARHQQRRVDLEAVELSPPLGKYLWDEGADPAIIAERREDDAMARESQRAIRQGLSPEEDRVWGLLGDGERRTDVFARALGIADWPVEARRREVKRVKDRLKKRFQRSWSAGG
ncbi:MAG: hypothetical protein ACRDIY_12895 [Chloroflexota bacterium]